MTDGGCTEGGVLVIEDDDDLRDTVREALEACGYRVLVAEHGAAALERLATEPPPCLILLDLMMPVMDGWTFLERVARDERLGSIPVIVSSAAGPLARDFGGRPLLRKPVRMADLLATVRCYCA